MSPCGNAILSGQAGEQAVSKGDYNTAMVHYQKAVQLNPNYGPYFSGLGLCYYDNGQYREAIDAFSKSLKLRNDIFAKQWGCVDEYNRPRDEGADAWIWMLMGMAYSELGQMDSAITSTKKAIDVAPDNVNAFLHLSNQYFKNKQYDLSIKVAMRALELTPGNAIAYCCIGKGYYEKKQYDEAMKALNKAIEIDPKITAPYEWLANVFEDKEAYSEAAEVYKKAIAAIPSNNSFYNLLTVQYYRMGKYDDAIAVSDKAIELQTYSGAGITIGNKDKYPVVAVLEKNGPAKKAGIQVGDKILRIDGVSTRGWASEKVTQKIRGAAGTQVAIMMSRNGIAKPFEKLITREVVASEKAAEAFGIRSILYRRKGNLEMASSDAEKGYTLSPSDGWAQFALGADYLDRGKNDEAIKLFSQDTNNPSARILEATAYARQGKTQEALAIYIAIPEEDLFAKHVPRAKCRLALLEVFKPLVKEHRDKARTLESKGKNKEALAELSEALKMADDAEAQAIQDSIFSITRKNPSLSEMTDEARRYALRSELLVKEGKFEQAAAELKNAIQISPYEERLYYNAAFISAELKRYSEAVRHMKVYIKAVPGAPDLSSAKDQIVKWEFEMERAKTP